MTTEQLEESIKRINAELDQDRIKLMTLRACFINLAGGYHIILKLRDNEHTGDNWRECKHSTCKSNLEVLRKLELE